MRLTEQVHLKLKEVLRSGDTAIDATAGNGHDTLAMAEFVGPSGKVFAIDLQSAAIDATRARLEAAGQMAQCELIEGDHADALKALLGQGITASAITFNLGYLPGGDKEVTTSSETTLCALNVAMHLIKPGGALLVTAYRGHDGGMEEADKVESWMRALSNSEWQIGSKEPPTRDLKRIPPILWIAARKT